jgi:septin family protein
MATPVQPLSENIAERDNKLRKKFKRFRVLILGRANAGKTTILQKVCNTDEQPEIFDSTGKKASILNIGDWSFRYNRVNRAHLDRSRCRNALR